jgi:ligand-binding sensor domain-containing protein
MNEALNINYWKSTNGPYEEIVYALAVNYNGHIFAGTYRSGVFRSNPYGTYWSQTSLINKHITSLIITPDKYIVVGTKEKGVFRSIDNGMSWTQTQLYKSDIHSLASDKDSNIYAGTLGEGIYFSKNKGSYWEKIGLDNLIVDSIKIIDNNKILAGTDSGLYLYNNNSWVKINNIVPDYDINVIEISNDNKIYIGTSGGLYVCDSELKESSEIKLEINKKNIWDIKFNSNNKMFVATDEGVFYSENIIDWNKINHGLGSNKVYSLTFNQDDYIYAGTFGWGVFKSQEKTT